MEVTNNQFYELKKIVGVLADFINSWIPQKKLKIGYPTPIVYRTTQRFGENSEIYKKWGYAGHFGIDFAAPYNSPVIACDDGIVLRAGYNTGNGNFIELKHTWGNSLYLHFKEPTGLLMGAGIKRNDEIGKVGNTGYVIPQPTTEKPLAGTHLHFSIKINGIKNKPYKDFVDPVEYLEI